MSVIPYSEFSELQGNVATADFVLDDGTSYQLNSTTLGSGTGGYPSYMGGSWMCSFSAASVNTPAFIGLNQDIDVFINYGNGTRLRYRVYLNDSQNTDPADTNVSSKHGGSADILFVVIRPGNNLPASTAPTTDTDTGGDTGGDTGTDTGGDTGGDTGTDTGGDTGGSGGAITGVDTSSILYNIGVAVKNELGVVQSSIPEYLDGSGGGSTDGGYDDFVAGFYSVTVAALTTLSAGISTSSEILASSPINPEGQVTIQYATDTEDIYVYDGSLWSKFENNEV